MRATSIWKARQRSHACMHYSIRGRLNRESNVANGITVVALTNTNPPTVETSTLTQQLLTIALANP